jgi:hypothetical protein
MISSPLILTGFRRAEIIILGFQFPPCPLVCDFTSKILPRDTRVACCAPMILKINVALTYLATIHVSVHHIKLQYDYLAQPLRIPTGTKKKTHPIAKSISRLFGSRPLDLSLTDLRMRTVCSSVTRPIYNILPVLTTYHPAGTLP